MTQNRDVRCIASVWESLQFVVVYNLNIVYWLMRKFRRGFQTTF